MSLHTQSYSRPFRQRATSGCLIMPSLMESILGAVHIQAVRTHDHVIEADVHDGCGCGLAAHAQLMMEPTASLTMLHTSSTSTTPPCGKYGTKRRPT